MAMSFSRPDPSSPSAVSTAAFTTSRKGFDQAEVRDFLRMVAAELARLQEREKFLERELRAAQRGTTNASVALDEEVVTRMLGEEAARILSTARDAASQIKVKAEEHASRMLREATDEAQRVREEADIESARRRQDAAADAEAELQMAKQQGRDMVNEARAYRERVLNELARRREMARQQIEQLVHGRDRLLQAFERARLAAVDVMAELTPLAEPNEYVNLAPTTGPVPLMVPAEEMKARRSAEAAAALEQTAEEHEADAAAAPATEGVVFDHEAEEPDDEVAPADDVALDEIVDDVDHTTEPDTDDEPEAADVAAETDEVDEPEETDEADEILDAGTTDVVALDIEPGAHADDDHDHDGEIAPVVALFGRAAEAADEDPDTDEEHHDPAPTAAIPRGTVDDLFAKLRAARAETVVERAADATQAIEVVEPVTDTEPEAHEEPVLPDSTMELAVFQPTPAAPVTAVEYDDTAFGRRDEALTPLIVSAARKLKRVLADEQNDVLHALRGAKSAVTIDTLLPSKDTHLAHYADAIRTELVAAAVAGAASLEDGRTADHEKTVAKFHATEPAVRALGAAVVQPLRERLERAVADTDGDKDELVGVIRAVYREWKTQRIDEHLDDVARTAFGRGAFVVLAPGTPVCWAVDPNGPDCPDAEDNSLAGVVPAGEAFPTDHLCAPAHEGCRCMLQRVPR